MSQKWLQLSNRGSNKGFSRPMVVTQHVDVGIEAVGIVNPAAAIVTALPVLLQGFARLIGHQPRLVDGIDVE